MNMSLFTTLGLVAATEPSIGTVVFTGIVIVFSVLVILYLIITLEGVIFSSIDKKKADKSKQAAKSAAKPTAAPKKDPAFDAARANIAPAAVIEEGISPDIVAAISAAVAAMDGGSRYAIRSMTRAPRGRSAWGSAGVASYTEPF